MFPFFLLGQSVLPGILQGDKSDSLLYGSVDNGKKICWNEDFHSKVGNEQTLQVNFILIDSCGIFCIFSNNLLHSSLASFHISMI